MASDNEKYKGCNVVGAVVTDARAAEGKKPTRIKKSFFIKLAIAAVIVGFICFVCFAPFDWLDPVHSALKSIFCYDFFGRESFGGTPLFSKINGR